jgi:excinuclease ABC subunit A
MPDRIVLRGARQHNLKNIDLEIPRDQLVVITGLSGSGKSSLAFDTIYAEGQRRYVESLSAYARQFLEQMEKPDVDSIEGLSPAISIEQKSTSNNPRSTVGTITEIYDYLRLLFARVGRPFCYNCGREITTQTVQQIVDRMMTWPEGTRVQILAPIIRGRKGEYRKELNELRRAGFVRAQIDGALRDLNEEIALNKNRNHTIEVVVDRLAIRAGIEKRLADSLELAFKHGGDLLKVERLSETGNEEVYFSQRFACVACGTSYPEITPRMFSFNSPHGACPNCSGIGSVTYFDPDLIVANEELSLSQGAIAPWTGHGVRMVLEALAAHYGFSLDQSWKSLSPRVRKAIMYGSGDEEVEFYHGRGGRGSYRRPFEGVLAWLERRYRESEWGGLRISLENYMSKRPCPTCNGSRLKKESLYVRFNGRSIQEVAAMTVGEALEFFSAPQLTAQEAEIARLVLKEIRERLRFMIDVGLDYLTLDRAAETLAGGEGQRIRLATQIGSSLVGVLYVLDEPSIGLHPRDNTRLLNTLKRLRDQGNTVLVVEHDREMMLQADHLIDMGPGAGADGGYVVAQGAPEELMRNSVSLTGQYLAGALEIPVPSRRRAVGTRWLTIKGARQNNLRDLTVNFPLGVMTCVTGVSGSGKSTLVLDTLYNALAQKLNGSHERPGAFDSIAGLEHLDKVINVDQAPIGRTPRSNPATYTGMFTPMRELFARLPEARMRGYGPGRFSFNVKGGRCEACEGGGVITIEMHFLPDVYVTCEVCGGRRYNRDTLAIHYKGKNIADVLDLSVGEAIQLLGTVPMIRHRLETLREVGLDYIRLGQPATTLSGGEAQRIKLAKELSRRATGRTLYILDEPTTGLHFEDIKKLLNVLGRLTDAGNTVIIIEHNLDVVKTADYVIDLGPEGGSAGGHVVATGTPEQIAISPQSHTGRYLQQVLNERAAA